MLNRSLLFAGLIFSQLSLGIHWEVIGQESKEPAFKGTTLVDLKQSVGDATIRILTENKIPYLGTAAGINSILNTPTGDAAIKVLSDDSMRVYGWCYEVDGVEPPKMPDAYLFPSQESTITWFFAYSLYEHGKWVECCTPAYKNPL